MGNWKYSLGLIAFAGSAAHGQTFQYLVDPTVNQVPPPQLCGSNLPDTPTVYNLVGTFPGTTTPFNVSPGRVYKTTGVACVVTAGTPPAAPFVAAYFTGIPPGTVFALGGPVLGGGGNELLYGHPNSVQYSAIRSALDLENVDVEGPARFTDEGDADTIGGAFTQFWVNGFRGQRFEGRFEKSWRPFSGSRTRAIVDVRATGVLVGSEGSGTGLVTGAVEFAAKPNWSITGRVGIGAVVASKYFGSGGALYTASATSRWRAAQLGRGDLVIGNSVVFTGITTTGGTKNAIFRSGVAYQFPLKGLVFGRQTSMRLSYANSYIVGDPVRYDNYHEFAVNFGVRLRQNEIRNRFESLRIGAIYTHASNYNSATLTVGYRF